MSDGHIALVLAAGGSRRLGRPKQLLTRDGETLVHRTVRLATESGAGRVLLVVGAGRAAVEAAVADLVCEVVFNTAWERGLAGSLKAAAARSSGAGGRVLILPCDLPGLEASHLHALVDGAAATASGCAATKLDDAVGVPAVVPAGWFEDLSRMDLSTQADHGFGARLRAIDPEALFVLDAVELAGDIDTQADVDAAVARGWLDRG
ncbi:nucleotidyltransferase family protein [Luteimonas viscosa]|uniref:Nucleotidyltransferase family protein n=1 Tax=Luteimonas viscosa TaxID=1132694 RepID=A0A5D4XNH2_9GAMM|nr:nucleotidyltransferase family protein [Luteimonas viscosa]TYT25505.1 nucleotidyltransferase family protein [Luteimonas viscosa]